MDSGAPRNCSAHVSCRIYHSSHLTKIILYHRQCIYRCNITLLRSSRDHASYCCCAPHSRVFVDPCHDLRGASLPFLYLAVGPHCVARPRLQIVSEIARCENTSHTSSYSAIFSVPSCLSASQTMQAVMPLPQLAMTPRSPFNIARVCSVPAAFSKAAKRPSEDL